MTRIDIDVKRMHLIVSHIGAGTVDIDVYACSDCEGIHLLCKDFEGDVAALTLSPDAARKIGHALIGCADEYETRKIPHD